MSNIQDQKLEARIDILDQQLVAANRRIAELEISNRDADRKLARLYEMPHTGSPHSFAYWCHRCVALAQIEQRGESQEARVCE